MHLQLEDIVETALMESITGALFLYEQAWQRQTISLCTGSSLTKINPENYRSRRPTESGIEAFNVLYTVVAFFRRSRQMQQ